MFDKRKLTIVLLFLACAVVAFALPFVVPSGLFLDTIAILFNVSFIFFGIFVLFPPRYRMSVPRVVGKENEGRKSGGRTEYV